MLYLFDDYINDYPNRVVAVLRKFADCDKNLHEMDIAEVNAIVGEWTGSAVKTISDYTVAIQCYLNWLTEKGIKTNWSANQINFPVSDTGFLIYNDDLLHEYWSKMLLAAEHDAIRRALPYNRDVFLVNYACDILAFYGLNEEQTLALELSDVSKDGVKGYDLPLTEKDLEILLEYKNLRAMANGKRLSGDTYIRSVSSELSWEFATRGSRRVWLSDGNLYLRKLLTPNNLYKLGRFAEIYAYENESGETIKLRGYSQPDYIIGKFEQIKGGKLDAKRLNFYRRSYLDYRQERNEYEKGQPVEEAVVISEPKEQEVVVPVANIEDALIYNRLEEILNDTNVLRNKITTLMKMLKDKN